MVSKIGWIIAAIIFLIFYYFVLNYIITQVGSYGYVARTSAMRSLVQNTWIALFTSSGIPENWEEKNVSILPGLRTNLYRVALIVNETNGTQRINAVLNVTMGFGCEKRINSSTVRVYEGNKELPTQLYETSFCSGTNYLNTSNIFFIANFSSYQSKIFYIYFSTEDKLEPITYSVPSTPSENFSYKIFPEEVISMLSFSKLTAFENFSYEEVRIALGIPENMHMEIEIVAIDTLLANKTFRYVGEPKGDVFAYPAPMLMQDKDGKIKYAMAVVEIWQT